MTQPRGKHLNAALARALDNRKSQSTIRNLTIQPPNSVDFSSNDFLSLATSQELRDSYLEELRTGPSTSHLGSGGSRLLDGNSTYAEQLEDDIAAFHRAEKGLLCNSGFDANVGLFSCLPQPRDVIVYDEFIHASVHDGMRLSRAGRRIAFAHNSAEALKSGIEQVIDSDEAIVSGHRNVFIAVEAVYSMDGDVAPLKDIVDVIHKLLPLGNGHLIVDEAHSNGVLGPQGRGLVCELGLEDQVSVRLHTFGKALACNGGTPDLLCRVSRSDRLTTRQPFSCVRH
jgi:8-amino-7-oxononanoate synthase